MWAAVFGWVHDWQTLVAGLLALLAGGLTVWGTLRAAKRQVKAANDAADREIKAASDAANRQITAAQEQTAAAQHQTAVMREIERRRISREGYAFFAMLEAAMASLIEDVQAARKLFLDEVKRDKSGEFPYPATIGTDLSLPAYLARQKVDNVIFQELRPAFLRFGGRQTAEFLRLDKAIMHYGSQIRTLAGNVFGAEAGLLDELNFIEQQAMELRDHALGGINLCREELASELINTDP
jgi:hypothetical protein